MLKKIFCLLFCMLLIFSLTACSGAIVWKNKTFDKKAESREIQDKTVITENERFRMEWVARNASVLLVDKQTGQSFGTTPSSEGEPEVDEFGLPLKKHPQVESAVTVEYLNNSTDVEEQTVSYTSAVSEGRVSASLIDNGVKVKYYFDDVKIMIPVEYVLREESVAVSVNAKEIQENDFRVTSISIMPFWCSVKNDAIDSYLFIPSGSGALINAKTVSQTGVTYSDQVYGNDPVMTENDRSVTKKNVRMPVYGAKSGNTATCAIIERSAESAVLEAKVGSSAIKYSGVYAKFQVRGYSPNFAQFMQGLKKQLNVYSRSMVDTKMTIGFYPLTGEEADYAGMANTYKKYLKSSGYNKILKDDSALNLTFIGGATVNKSFLGVPYRDVLPATTLKEVKDCLKEISEKTNARINARLVGFGANGIDRESYAGGFKLNKNFGTLKELSKLSSFCKENDIGLYFDFDIISLKNNGAGYNKLFDTAYSSLNKIADVYEYNVATRSKIDTSKYNLLRRDLLGKAAQKLIDKTKK